MTQRLPFPRPSLPQELTLIEQVSGSDNVQVQTHHEVRQTQARDKNMETRSRGLLLKEQPIEYRVMFYPTKGNSAKFNLS